MMVDYFGWSELAVTDVVSGPGLKKFFSEFFDDDTSRRNRKIDRSLIKKQLDYVLTIRKCMII